MAWTAVLPLLIAGAAGAQQGARTGPADGADLPATEIGRVAVGTSAPDFTLARNGGGTVTLSQFRGLKNVVLVFYRGYWCPFCIKQLSELRTLLDDDLRKDTELLVVAIDGENETRQTVGRIARDGVEPDFTFLSDPDHRVIDRYGILNPEGSRRGIPHPATYVIDRDGIVRWRFVEVDYKVRPSNAAILEALAGVRGR
jgi:peroxiredoxin